MLSVDRGIGIPTCGTRCCVVQTAGRDTFVYITTCGTSGFALVPTAGRLTFLVKRAALANPCDAESLYENSVSLCLFLSSNAYYLLSYVKLGLVVGKTKQISDSLNSLEDHTHLTLFGWYDLLG